jgi:ABC-type amino acid transport substrate-binding protein
MDLPTRLMRIIRKTFITTIVFFLGLSCLTMPAIAVEIQYFQEILDRGYFKVGIPPYDTPPYYYFDNATDQMEGSDIDIVRKFANNIGVEAVFDRKSKTYNGLLKRTGSDEFDLSIGKLSTFYKRMEDAHPHEYMQFRHAFLANRKIISKLQGQAPDNELAPLLLSSTMKIGVIDDSSYAEFASELFPNAAKVSFIDWNSCKTALLEKKVDAIYRDATEVKKIVYEEPNLSLDFVPILFDDKIDHISMYVSSKINPDISPMLDYYISKDLGIKTDKEIMDEYSVFFQPSKKSN